MDAHGGIQARVKAFRLPEYGYREFIFLNRFAGPIDGMLGQEREEMPQDFGTGEFPAVQNPVHLLSDDGGGHGTVLHVARHLGLAAKYMSILC